ncbi:MAG: HEAT repeat domain-containing protein, partial [Actinomycetota bacterium]
GSLATQRGRFPPHLSSYHPDERLRFAVACALPSCCSDDDTPPDIAVDALLGLMEDDDEDVRDGATFGLGSQLDADSSVARDALVQRYGDANLDARDEAIVGLARRRDPRAYEIVAARLSEDSIGTLAVEAAQHLADAQFLPALGALTTWWDVNPGLLEDAIAACDPGLRRQRERWQEALYESLAREVPQVAPGLTPTLFCPRMRVASTWWWKWRLNGQDPCRCFPTIFTGSSRSAQAATWQPPWRPSSAISVTRLVGATSRGGPPSIERPWGAR